jgi:hypothetical protein
VLAAATAGLGATVEYDLDGVLDNGPDHLTVADLGTFPVNVWIFGPPVGCWAFGTIMCNPGHGLVYVSCVYNLPGGGWTTIPHPNDPNCVTIDAYDFAADLLMVFPWRVATVTWRCAVEASVQTLVSAPTSGISGPSFSEVSFSNNGIPLASVAVQPSATEATSWGSIKSTFR